MSMPAFNADAVTDKDIADIAAYRICAKFVK